MDKHQQLTQYLKLNAHVLGKVIDFTDDDLFLPLDFTEANTQLSNTIINSTPLFCQWVTQTLQQQGCRFGIGGYLEHRSIYRRSPLFDDGQQPRNLHLGIDIWAHAGTPVYSPLPGVVHSFKDNHGFGDYGPTIILAHNLGGLTLYTLFGHLNRACLLQLKPGMPIAAGQLLGNLGQPHENGEWPPHLHLQLMFDLQGKQGDYPGVCSIASKDAYAANVPNPMLLLHIKPQNIKQPV